MSQEKIASKLKIAMGLHSETVGMVTVSNAISRRMNHRGIRTHEEYLKHLNESHNEMQELIEAVIIPETWFFRDETPYPEIVKYINKRLNEGCIPPVNILSIPCSTGEEPYSIAMSLDETHLDPDLYRINAFDISQNNIEKAKRATYRKNSFRSSRDDFIAKYFKQDNSNYYLSEKIKEQVNFYQGNVLDDSFIKAEGIYDVILCRNLLIYFDKPTQARVFETLHKLLKKDGILILGHAETHHSSRDLFEPLGHGLSYIFRKYAENKKKTFDADHLKPPGKHSIVSPGIKVKRAPKPFANSRIPDKERIPQTDNSQIETALSLANSGQTDDAREICLSCLENDASNTEAHYLLGVIYDVEGDSKKAEEYMRKTVYLDPCHYKALIHLSLMIEQSGDTTAAKRFRDRAQKAQESIGIL